MATEDTSLIAQQVMERLDRRDLDGVYALYAPDAMFTGWTPQPVDTAGNRQYMSALLAAFPDSRFVVDEYIVAGERAAIRHRFLGTHQGPFQGLPATGKAVEVSGIVILHVQNGQVRGGYLNVDALGMLQQVGAIPMPAE